MRINERSTCWGVRPCVPLRLLQAPDQVSPDAFDDGALLIEELRDALQGGLELDTLLHELQIGEAHLGVRRSHRSPA